MHPDLTCADRAVDLRRRDLLAEAAPAAPPESGPRLVALRASAGRALVRAGRRLQGLPPPLGAAPVPAGR